MPSNATLARQLVLASVALSGLATSVQAQCLIQSPTNTAVCAGNPAVFIALGANEQVGGTYQWFRNGQIIPGATSRIYTLPTTTTNDGGALFTVRYSRSGLPPLIQPCSETSAPARLDVYTGPVIDPIPDQGVAVGTPLVLSVSNRGPAPSSYQWEKDGVEIPGATSATLRLEPFQASDAGSYTCVVTVCGTPGRSRAALVTARTDATATSYSEFLLSTTATEIVRSSYVRTPNPRMIGVLASIPRLLARNPNLTAAQLSQFITQYDSALRTAYPSDPNLFRGFNFQTAVRFVARVSIPGVYTDIGADVLRDLGLDPQGDNPNRERQMAAFQDAKVHSFAASDDVAQVLQNLFQNKDATGRSTGLGAAQAAAYLRSLSIEPYPSREQLAANFPEVLVALNMMPDTPEAFYQELAAGFPTIRAQIDSEIGVVRAKIAQQVGLIDDILAQQPTLADTVNTSRTRADIVNAALAQRQADLLEISRSRSILSFGTTAMLRGTIEQQQIATTRREFSNVTIQVATSTVDTVSTGLYGAGTILSGIGSFAQGPTGIVSGIGNIIAGTSTLLPLFIDDTSNVPSADQQIRDAITDVQNQMEQFRVEMVDRFNRIDATLLATYDAVNQGFEAVTLQLQGIDQSLSEVQQDLALANSNLARFEQNLYGILNDGFNIFFRTDMNTAIGYRQRFGFDMPPSDFARFEGNFWSYATDYCDDVGYAGTDSLPYDATGLTQLTFNNSNPIGLQINGLRTFPSQLGLSTLGSQRTANPTSWSLNADTYAQLARENPWYFAPVADSPEQRINSILTVGQRAQNVMSAAKSTALFNQLIDGPGGLTSRLNTLAANADGALPLYLNSLGLGAINPWGGPSQSVNAALTPANTAMREYNSTCAGTFCNSRTPLDGQANAVWIDAFLPAPYKLASHLGLTNRNISKYHFTYRVANSNGNQSPLEPWTLDSSGQVYRATIDVELWWNPTDQGLFGNVYIPGDNRGMFLVATRRFQMIMRPNTPGRTSWPIDSFKAIWGPEHRLSDMPTMNGYTYQRFFDNDSTGITFTNSNGTAPLRAMDEQGVIVPVWTATTIINQDSLTQVTNEVNNRLRQLQAGYFDRLVQALGNGADLANIRGAADLASVNVKLIDAYLSIACPESMLQSDLLRGSLRGYELGMDRSAFQTWFANLRDQVNALPNNTPAPTVRPNPATELTRRLNLFRPELAAALARPQEVYPFMAWTLASLQNLQQTAKKLARDDQFITPPNTTLTVPSPGVLANDQRQAGASVTAVLLNAPASGTLNLNPNGGFTYTPAPSFTGQVSFTYRARGEVATQSGTSIVFSDPATVLITVQPCAPSIIDQPDSLPFTQGSVAAFRVEVAPTLTQPSYQWRHDGLPLANGSRVFGAQSPALIVTNLSTDDLGRYDCLVTSACGSVLSSPAFLGAACVADVDDGTGTGTPDGGVTIDDLLFYLSVYTLGDSRADVDDGSSTGTRDGGVTIDDLLFFVARYADGC